MTTRSFLADLSIDLELLYFATRPCTSYFAVPRTIYVGTAPWLCLIRIAIYKPLHTVKNHANHAEATLSEMFYTHTFAFYLQCLQVENSFFEKRDIFTSVRELCTEFYAVFLYMSYTSGNTYVRGGACLSLGAWAILLF